MLTKKNSVWLICLLGMSVMVHAKQTITIKATEGDATPIVRNAIETASDKDLKLVFEKGIYTFQPDYALDRYSQISNHGNGLKKVVFRLDGFDAIEIEGNGSEFIFHGQIAPFQVENCKKVMIKNITIDWDIPFLFQGEVLAVNAKEGWWDMKPFTKGYSWKMLKNKVVFPNINGFNYLSFGQTLSFDPKTKAVFHGDFTFDSEPDKVEQLANGTLRFHQVLKNYPSVGSIIGSKGDRENDRYAPAFQMQNSSNVVMDKVIVHHALGMGFLFERTENIKVLNSGVYVRKGSDRVISSTADATHFANCKGDILVENCRFESMLDDGTNVHGTYVTVDKILDAYTVRVGLEHFEQLGFQFADKGDKIWFIQKPSPQRGVENEVKSVKMVNEKYTDLTFKEKVPTALSKGDLLENKTWNPRFTMRKCSISKHRARNIIIKTPEKIVIEDNYLSSDMSSIMLRGESHFWFESGAVGDVLIRNNHFVDCAHGGLEHAVLRVSPVLSKTFNQTELYDRNIRFENNTIETFDNRIFWGDRVDGLSIKNNTIKQTKGLKQLYPNAPLFDFNNCQNVEISGNTYEGTATNTIKVDEATKKTLTVKNNKGF